MRKSIWLTTAALVVLLSGSAFAQYNRGWMMGGPGMMHGRDGMMGGGYCPNMMGDGKVEVKEIKNGISITITSDDKAEVARIQKHGQVMKLMHEIYDEEKTSK